MTQSTINISRLPAPDVVETIDFEAIYAARKDELIARFPPEHQAEVSETLTLESEPSVKLLQEGAYRETILRQRINEAARACMLAYASGADLDNLAAGFEVQRLTLVPSDDTTTPPTPAIMESDADLRRRTQLAPEGATAAGSRQAYRFYALSADPDVADVEIQSPSPGEVAVYVLSRSGNGTPSEDVLGAVLAALSAEDVRPINDYVIVRPVDLVLFTVSATLYVQPGPALSVVADAAQEALQAYLRRSDRIGDGVPLSAIYAALHQTGVVRVELTSPQVDIVCASTQVAHCTSIDLHAVREVGHG